MYYSWSTFVSVFMIKRPMGVSAARARGVLMVKILNKCILSILVYNLLNRQTSQHFIYTAIFQSIGILAVCEIEIHFLYARLEKSGRIMGTRAGDRRRTEHLSAQ